MITKIQKDKHAICTILNTLFTITSSMFEATLFKIFLQCKSSKNSAFLAASRRRGSSSLMRWVITV